MSAVSCLVKLTCDAFCNLCDHIYQCVNLLFTLQERVQIHLSLCQNNVCINRNYPRSGIFLVCGRHNATNYN